MANGNVNAAVTPDQLNNVQGDIWSQGFPKNYEAYYFFSIVPGQEKGFSQSLKQLTEGETPLISNLKKVKDDRERIRNGGPVTNALIAFTFSGLEAIDSALSGDGPLCLDDVEETDPAFFTGMTPGRKKTGLNDPARETWDPLFQSEKDIHGLLKVAGNDEATVSSLLDRIKSTLGYDDFIRDVPVAPPHTGVSSRVDGWTRPRPNRGKEHFGFQDGISQPRMDGIDDLELPPNDGDLTTNMNTHPNLIIVSRDSHKENIEHERPEWMYDGSFLVFRKLEQDVAGWEALTDKWMEKNCVSKEHLGSKLMGRWTNGRPVSLPRQRPNAAPQPGQPGEEDVVTENDFAFGPGHECPYSSHIRKSNLRVHTDFTDPQDERSRRTRIVRCGIPYGSEYNPDADDGTPRGLLFACYQSQIEDGFVHLQARWSNRPDFPEPGTGHDPIIGQVPQEAPGRNGMLTTYFIDTNNNQHQSVTFRQLVTLKGGSYFFVPSISALSGILSSATA